MGSLYQDPMAAVPMIVMDDTIGLRMVPDEMRLTDPVFLRHVLCGSIVLHNLFHVVLCYRQLRTCNHHQEPPRQMRAVMSPASFQEAKNTEMHAVDLQLMSYVFDAIFSCIELYFGVFHTLWDRTMALYGNVGELVWRNLAYMALFSTYMVLRLLPLVFYEKLMLDNRYNVDPETAPPLVGVVCALAFVIVFVQVLLIPFTAIFLYIEIHGGYYFVLWIWGFLFAVSVLALVFFSLFGLPCLGKSSTLPEGSLRSALLEVLEDYKFPAHRVSLMHTFHIAKATAYVWGYCCCKRLVILDNLILNRAMPLAELLPEEVDLGLSDSQVAAFVAHQLSHWRHYHMLKGFILVHVSLIIYMVLFGTCYHVHALYEAAGFPHNSYPIIVGYWLVYKYVMPPYLTISNWIVFYFIRHSEYRADNEAWRMGYGHSLREALLKLFADHSVFPFDDHWYLMWYRTRPSCLQRIRNLQRLDLGTRLSMIELI
ncbi:CAAX prenyl protease 1 homolog [Drosophila miranda]|uniref:CAAX prenyl protease 1 homolog n=1 Tax=Drosophila miranda TaxID=7229 RepID=UPI0007E63EF2|nr:CAAX prenyl protease 1 homolog [Drosophila miranda]